MKLECWGYQLLFLTWKLPGGVSQLNPLMPPEQKLQDHFLHPHHLYNCTIVQMIECLFRVRWCCLARDGGIIDQPGSIFSGESRVWFKIVEYESIWFFLEWRLAFLSKFTGEKVPGVFKINEWSNLTQPVRYIGRSLLFDWLRKLLRKLNLRRIYSEKLRCPVLAPYDHLDQLMMEGKSELEESAARNSQ